jgi:hypothetical protein
MCAGAEPIHEKEKERNCLLIPNANYNKHLVYVSLCMYRFSQNQPGLAYAILEGMKRGNLNFFQVLQYACLRRSTWPGHTFYGAYAKVVDQKTFSNSVYQSKNTYCLKQSIALKKLFLDNPLPKDQVYTTSLVEAIIQKIPGDFTINKTVSFLNPLLAKLYDDISDYKEIIAEVNKN